MLRSQWSVCQTTYQLLSLRTTSQLEETILETRLPILPGVVSITVSVKLVSNKAFRGLQRAAHYVIQCCFQTLQLLKK